MELKFSGERIADVQAWLEKMNRSNNKLSTCPGGVFAPYGKWGCGDCNFLFPGDLVNGYHCPCNRLSVEYVITKAQLITVAEG